MVREISFKNYKIFKEKQTLEIKPITILIGKNNSGKSAILKLPVLVSESLNGEPIKWDYKIGDHHIHLGTDFKDLVYNKSLIGAIELSISNNKNTIDVSFTKDDLILEYKLNGNTIDSESNFKGFLIDGKSIEDLNLKFDYIGAIREVPKIDYIYSKEKNIKIGFKGQGAYPLLIDDFKNNGELLARISDWYKSNFENWDLKVLENKNTTGTKYEIAISNSNIDPINISQTGQGIHQVLPIIVRSFIKDEEPTLIIIEEPEMNLHPAAHGNLAERIADSTIYDKNKNYLIETHSQNFVLRLRRLVAEGKISHEDIALYYVDFNEVKNESSLEKIKIDKLGQVSFWPYGIFNEALSESIAIRTAQLDSQKHDN